MENKERAKKIVKTFINSCEQNGIPLEKGWGLFEEMMSLVERGEMDEKVWKSLIDKTIEESQSEAGATL